MVGFAPVPPVPPVRGRAVASREQAVVEHRPGRSDPEPTGDLLAGVVPWVVGLLTGVLAAAVPIARYRVFSTPSWDNAIFEQAVRGYAGLGAPVSDIKGPGYVLLGDHFSPILALLAPFYRLAPDARTLMVAQAVLIALAVGVVTAAAVRWLGTPAGCAVGVACGLSFGVQQAAAVDFHEVAFSAPLLALAGVAHLDRRWPAVVGWSLPLLLVNEELGVTVAAIGGVLVLRGARRCGALLLGAGLAWVALAVLVLIPAFNPQGRYDYVGHLGAGGNPLAALAVAWPEKLGTLAVTVAITGFLALVSPWALVAVPTFAWRFVGDNPAYWGTDWHYSLGLMPVASVALVDAIVRLRGTSSPRWLRAYVALAPALVLSIAVGSSFGGPFAQVLGPAAWRTPPEVDDARAALAAVPPRARVESDLGLLTHLVADRTVYWPGTDAGADVDHVARRDPAPGAAARLLAATTQQHPGTTWRVVVDRGGFIVLRRVTPTAADPGAPAAGSLPPARPDGPRSTTPGR